MLIRNGTITLAKRRNNRMKKYKDFQFPMIKSERFLKVRYGTKPLAQNYGKLRFCRNW